MFEFYKWEGALYVDGQTGAIAGSIKKNEDGFFFSPVNKTYGLWLDIVKCTYISEDHVRYAVTSVIQKEDEYQKEYKARKAARDAALAQSIAHWENLPWFIRFFTRHPESERFARK